MGLIAEKLPSTSPCLSKIITPMRILHTADWHLGDRLGRIDRTDDIRRAVERVGGYCIQEHVDVLLLAGDLFSELSRPDSLRESIEHLQATFEPFLLGGGTLLAITGNHDNENFCQTLRLVMDLAAPAWGKPGDLCPPGRLYLATTPTLLRLADRQRQTVQFLLMPYPTPTRYLEGEESHRYGSLEEKNRLLQAAFGRRLQALRDAPAYDPRLPAVLAAHIHVRSATLPSLFRLGEQESIVFAEDDLPADLAYVALGHIHQPQALRDVAHIRYCGSIERLDLGERDDEKGVVVVDIGRSGRQGEPRWLPLPATAIYALDLRDPRTDIPRLRADYADANRDLVYLHFTYTAGKDNLEGILRDLEDIFPRWYARDWTDAEALGPAETITEPNRAQSLGDTVRDYLRQELVNQPEALRDAVLARAEALLRDVQT
jgi:exonuclease SbcD